MEQNNITSTIAPFRAWISRQVSHYDASHDIVHLDNVVAHAIHILDENNVDKNCNIYFSTIFAALAHDICDKKYVRNVKSKLNLMVSTMKRLNIPDSIISTVENVVPRISFSKRLREGEPLDLSKEDLFVYRVVSDADMLEAMGATGVVRTYMFQAVHGHTAKGAWIHTTNTLFRCNEYLVFNYSKVEGSKRLMRMKRICEELKLEREIM